MTLQAGKMYRPSDVAVDVANDTIYVAEQLNHRISKWNYTPGSFTFTIDAGQLTSITITAAGTGYVALDPVVISAPTLNIANPVNATAVVATVGGGGEILTFTITNPGNGYDPNNLPTVVADETTGSGAILAAVVSTPWGSNLDGTTGKAGPIVAGAGGGPSDTNLDRPSGIVFDGTRLVVTDTFHNRIRTLAISDGAFIASVGQGGFGLTDFHHPAGIATDGTTLVIADELNHRAVKYTVGATPSAPALLPSPTPLAFNRPHGVIFDVTNSFFSVTDSLRGVISRYNTAATSFSAQFGTPGSAPPPSTNIFFAGSGHGTLTGNSSTAFADTRNNVLKTLATDTIANTTGTTKGTGDGQLFHPESVSSFTDTANYVLAANTLNNRVETYSNTAVALTFQTNFGKP